MEIIIFVWDHIMIHLLKLKLKLVNQKLMLLETQLMK